MVIFDMTRPSWDEYFMNMTDLVKQRATCLRRKVGAVIVKNKQILSTGYNGAPMGLEHCETCLRKEMDIPSGEKQEICRATHAEQNAIAQSALHGVSINGATIYCTNFPCVTCMKLLLNAGIKEVVYGDDYNDELAKKIGKESGITIRQVKVDKDA